MKILFVCHGNICRSPMAEGMLLRLCREHGMAWVVDSAGMSDEHDGEDMHPNTRKILEKHNAVYQHSARQIAPTDAQFDLIMAATRYQARQLEQRFPNTMVRTMLENKDVPDPWYGTYADYEAVYAMLEPAMQQLVLEFNNGR
jgi:protein-tyrosine phosphatase